MRSIFKMKLNHCFLIILNIKICFSIIAYKRDMMTGWHHTKLNDTSVQKETEFQDAFSFCGRFLLKTFSQYSWNYAIFFGTSNMHKCMDIGTYMPTVFNFGTRLFFGNIIFILKYRIFSKKFDLA